MSLLPLLTETRSLARALGWVPPAPKPRLLLLPTHDSFSRYFLDSLTLLRTRNDVPEMQKTHPQTGFCPSLVSCRHLPLALLQLPQHEQELSQRDFSPIRAGRFRHLLGKASWEVSSLFFCKCNMFSYTLGKRPSLWLFV